MIDPDRVLLTARCALRHPRMADAVGILRAVTDPSFPEELPIAQLRTLAQIEGAIERRQRRWQTGVGYSWCVELRATNSLMGMVGLVREESSDDWSLGYWIHPAHWRLGYATEVAAEAVRVGFEELGAGRILAGAALWNTASQRVLEKLGFIFDCQNPRGYEIQTRPIPTREYALERQRWRARCGSGP
jgi:RimJ/RimL family protein N-acetyltransferase